MTADVVIIVECPRCHRPVCDLDWEVDHAEILGTIHAENMDPRGTSTKTPWERRNPKWSSWVTSNDPAGEVGVGTFDGRKVIHHRGKTCRVDQPVTQETLTAAYQRAIEQAKRRISLRDLRT